MVWINHHQARRRHKIVERTGTGTGTSPRHSAQFASHPPRTAVTGGGGRGWHLKTASRTRWRLRRPFQRRGGDKLVGKMLVVGGSLIFVAYGALFLRLSHLLQDEQQYSNSNSNSSMRGKDSYLLPLPKRTKHDHHHRSDRPPPQSEAATRVLEYLSSSSLDAIRRRAEERRKRTRPLHHVTTLDAYGKMTAPYHFQFLKDETSFLGTAVQEDFEKKEEEEEGRQRPVPSANNNNSTTKKRCGIEAQNAFAANPSFFPDIHTVNEDSVILITGILGRIGFHLTLKLATECNAQVLIGVDSTYPNDTKHKLQLLKKFTIISSQRPTMKQPFIVTSDGLNPNPSQGHYQRYQHFEDLLDRKTGDFNYATFAKPTHVVHLLSAQEDDFRARDDDGIGGNYYSPYASNGGLFRLRQSLLATELLLNNLGHGGTTTLKQELHFTFVSDVNILKNSSDEDKGPMKNTKETKRGGLFSVTKLMEEVLQQSYAAKFKTKHSVVVLRFPTVYGPWGGAGSFDHDLTEKAIQHWHDKNTMMMYQEAGVQESILLQLAEQSGGPQSKFKHDILFVDDAVNAILSGMQYHDKKSDVSAFNILSGEKASISDMAHMIESYMPIPTHAKTKSLGRPIYDELGRDSSQLSHKASKQLHWEPRIFLRTGVKKLLAWHLDQYRASGPPLHHDPDILSAVETGQAFRIRVGDHLCDPDDEYCLRGRRIVPCASECSDPLSCTKNVVLDRLSELSQKVTQNCETVLYMVSLNETISSLPVVGPEIGDSYACSLAFILNSSKLATNLLTMNGMKESYSNGKWKIILVDADDELDLTELQRLLKISPGAFFYSSIKSALFIPENFSIDPELENIISTVKLLHEKMDMFSSFSSQLFANVVNKVIYKLESSELRAPILMPGLLDKYRQQTYDEIFGTTKAKEIHLEKKATPIMPLTDKERECSRHQIQFYDEVAAILNSHDFDDPDVEYPVYSLETWATRSLWVVHNFETGVSEEARNLRCEWYREQTRWSDQNDSLSFAHVMALLDIERHNNYLLDKQTKARTTENDRVNEGSMHIDEHAEWPKFQSGFQFPKHEQSHGKAEEAAPSAHEFKRDARRHQTKPHVASMAQFHPLQYKKARFPFRAQSFPTKSRDTIKRHVFGSS